MKKLRKPYPFSFLAGSVLESDLLHHLDRNAHLTGSDRGVRRPLVPDQVPHPASVDRLHRLRSWRVHLGTGWIFTFFKKNIDIL